MPQIPRDWLVFDMDGVLVDVRRSFPVAIERTLAALGGGELAAGEIAGLKRAGGYNNDWDVTRELLRQRGHDVARERVIEVFNQHYLGHNGDGGLILEEDWLLPTELLEELGTRFQLAIFTGRPRADAQFTLRRFDLEGRFARLVALEDVAAQKPDPAGLLRLRLEAAPGRLAAFIGDTVDDARCAAAAAVPFVGVTESEEVRALFRGCGCQFLAGDVAAAARHMLGRR